MSASFISFLIKKSVTKGTYSNFPYAFFLLTPPPFSQENKGPAGSTLPAGHVFKSRTHLCLVRACWLDWMDWRNQHQVFHSCTSVLLYSFSDKFRVDTQQVPICWKNHPNLSVAAQKFARSTTELLRQNISSWLRAQVCRQKERKDILSLRMSQGQEEEVWLAGEALFI